MIFAIKCVEKGQGAMYNIFMKMQGTPSEELLRWRPEGC